MKDMYPDGIPLLLIGGYRHKVSEELHCEHIGSSRSHFDFLLRQDSQAIG